MQPGQHSSCHKQLHSTTRLRTAWKSPVKCSKAMQGKEINKIPLALWLFWFWAQLIISLTCTDTFLWGMFRFRNVFLKTDTYYIRIAHCILLMKKKESSGGVLYLRKWTSLASTKCQMQDSILYPVKKEEHLQYLVKNIRWHINAKKETSQASLGARNILESSRESNRNQTGVWLDVAKTYTDQSLTTSSLWIQTTTIYPTTLEE